jgi:hypothetical protein
MIAGASGAAGDVADGEVGDEVSALGRDVAAGMVVAMGNAAAGDMATGGAVAPADATRCGDSVDARDVPTLGGDAAGGALCGMASGCGGGAVASGRAISVAAGAVASSSRAGTVIDVPGATVRVIGSVGSASSGGGEAGA